MSIIYMRLARKTASGLVLGTGDAVLASSGLDYLQPRHAQLQQQSDNRSGMKERQQEEKE